MKTIVLYHGSCTDGFGAALAAYLVFRANAEYIPVNYGPLKEELFNTLAHANVFILDFSFPREYMMRVLDVAAHVTWLDHHKSAFDDWLGCDYLTEQRQHCSCSEVITGSKSTGIKTISCKIVLDNTRSGALLAWDHFFPNISPPILFKHLDDYDRWQFNIRNTKAFLRNLRSLDMTFDVWEELNSAFTEDTAYYDTFISEGRAIDRYYWSQVNNMFKLTKRPIRIQGAGGVYYDVFASNVNPCFTSDVGHLLAKDSGTFGLCWYLNKYGNLACSLRSVNGFDVSVIAEFYGGGGHKSAAGFSVSMDTLQKWLYDGAHKDDTPVGFWKRVITTIKKWAAYL